MSTTDLTITRKQMDAIAEAIRSGLRETRELDFDAIQAEDDESGVSVEWEHKAFAKARRLTEKAGMQWDWTGWREALLAIEMHSMLGGIGVREVR